MPADELYLTGAGRLYDAVSRRLADAVPREHPSPGALVIAIHDDGRLDRDLALQRAARAAGSRLLHVRLDGPLGIVGPTVEPGAPGCLACAELRRRAVARLPLGADLRAGPRRPGAEHTVPFVEAVAEIAAEVARSRRALASRTFVLQAADLTGQWHDFQPVPACRECGELAADAPRDTWTERSGIAPAVPGGFRERPLPAGDEMRRHLLDWRYGVVPHVFRVQGNTPLAMSGSQFMMRDGTRDAGWGRATSYARAEAIAFFEAIERYACLEPRNRRLVVRGPRSSFGDDALDPRTLGDRDPELAAQLPRGWRTYSDDLEITWVWGYSLGRARPLLVPAQCVYYGLRGEPNRFVQESSNGAASGMSIQEAVLHGIFEIIERDAFLLTWYGRLPVPQIQVDGARTPEIGFLLDKAEAHGYRVHLFDATMDLEVTTVWGLAVSQSADRPRSFSAAGAHPDPEQAVLGALREVIPDALLHQRKPEHTEEALRRMLHDPGLVQTLDDHVALYTLGEAFERLEFLFEGRTVPLAEVAPGWRDRWTRPTLDDSLGALLAHLASRGLDVIIVEVTAPEQRALGQRSVKVLVPGTLPMTFGAAQRRTWGLSRLLEVPRRLGFWSAPRAYDELTQYPHPFP